MTSRWGSLLLWSPRVLGILVCLFLSVFALDAFEGGKTFLQGLGDFLLHLSPMLILLGVVALSWRWQWIGGVVFTVLGLAYALYAGLPRHHPEWILPIAGPLLLVGVLFLVSWIRRAKDRATL
ncbi:MAG: hypothetical protein FJ206_15845 [Gemmatimonadetes bacterium]|nr:hypothetical protein [Gemmatimonadota bacterium]